MEGGGHTVLVRNDAFLHALISRELVGRLEQHLHGYNNWGKNDLIRFGDLDLNFKVTASERV